MATDSLWRELTASTVPYIEGDIPFSYAVAVMLYINIPALRINDIPDPDGTISWITPEGWDVSPNGYTITLNSFDNTESKPLIAKYTTSGEIYYDTLYVHFNEDYWVPMNNLPAQTISPSMQIGNKVKEINVYPSPASNSVTLELGASSSNSLVEIFDLNGRLIHSTTTKLTISR